MAAEKYVAELQAQLDRMKANILAEEEDDDEDCSGMTDAQTNAFLEAILIIFENCNTKEECSQALRRIIAALRGEQTE